MDGHRPGLINIWRFTELRVRRLGAKVALECTPELQTTTLPCIAALVTQARSCPFHQGVKDRPRDSRDIQSNGTTPSLQAFDQKRTSALIIRSTPRSAVCIWVSLINFHRGMYRCVQTCPPTCAYLVSKCMPRWSVTPRSVLFAKWSRELHAAHQSWRRRWHFARLPWGKVAECVHNASGKSGAVARTTKTQTPVHALAQHKSMMAVFAFSTPQWF